jgi:hypothetical protein
MKYLIIVCSFYFIGCSVNKDTHDLVGQMSAMNKRVQENTDELKKIQRQPEVLEEKNIPKVDISQKSEEELTEIAIKAKTIAENPPEPSASPIPPIDIQDPPTNIPAKKQALIYRIKAYLRQIFKRKQ